MESSIMFKLGIEKAYIHLNWNFRLGDLKQMGFGNKWLKWMDGIMHKNNTVLQFWLMENQLVFIQQKEDSDRVIPATLSIYHGHGGFNSMMKIATQKKWLQGFTNGNRVDETLEIYYLL